MPAPPRSFLIIPDPLVVGSGAGLVESYTSADGLYPDVAVPRIANQGAVTFQQSGTPTTERDLTYQVVASGGVWREGTWAWKRKADSFAATDIGWRGANDNRYSHAPHGVVEANATWSASCAFMRSLQRELVYHVKANGTLEVYYRDIPDDHIYGDSASTAPWTQADVVDTVAQDDIVLNGNDELDLMDVCELRDGDLLMVTADTTMHFRDITVWISEDGINFRPVADWVLSRFGTFGKNKHNEYGGWYLDRSGDYVRLCFLWYDTDNLGGAGAGWYLRTLISSDRGASWTEVTVINATYQPFEAAVGIQFTRFFCMAGLDDDAGTFLLFVRDSQQITDVHRASGFDGWAVESGLQLTHPANTIVRGMGAVRGPTWFMLFMLTSPPDPAAAATDVDFDLYLADPRDITNTSSWRVGGSTYHLTGVARYNPRHFKLANCGHYVSMVGPLFDADTETHPDDGLLYLRWGGWDPLPAEERSHPMFEDAHPYQHQPGDVPVGYGTNQYIHRLHLIAWDVWTGAPAPSGAADVATTTPWTRSAHALTTQAWNPWELAYADVVSSVNQWTNQYVDATPTWSWACAATPEGGTDQFGWSCLEVIIRVANGGSTSNDDVACRLKSYDVNGASGHEIDVSMRFAAAGVDVYDNVAAASVLSDLTLALGTRFYKFRLVFITEGVTGGNPCKVALWYRDEETAGSTWQYVGHADLDEGGAHATQSLEWGHLRSFNVGATPRQSRWRRCALMGPHDGGGSRKVPNLWYNPLTSVEDTILDNLRGRVMSHDEILVESGVYAVAGGGGGFEGDIYDGEVIPGYAPSNVARIASPRVGWRGSVPAAGASQSDVLIFDAGHERSVERFQHHSLGLFGLNDRTVIVDYADDAAFTTGVVAVGTLDTTRWGPLRVQTAEGNVLTLTASQSGLPPLGSIPSDPARGVTHYLRVTTPGPATSSLIEGQTFRVLMEEHSGDQRSYRLDTGTDLADYAPVLGSSVVIFSDRGVLIYSSAIQAKRYMRLQFPAEFTADTGRHQLGSMIPGVSVPFDVALDWTHTDAEAPNTSIHRTRGAVRWGYQEAPPQRTWQGRVVGDASGWRERIRPYLRATARHDVHPVVLVTDETKLLDPDRVILGHIKSGAQLSQHGWKWDSAASTWYPVGDQGLKLIEES